MRYSILVSLLVCVLTTHAQSRFNAGDQVPDFDLRGYDGTPISIQSTESKVIILDFWASWCAPCLKSVKSTLKPLYKEFSREDVEIIGISNDQQEEKWKAAIERWELPWKNIWDEGNELVKSYQVRAIPTYVLVNQSGKVLANGVPSSDLKSEVKKALKASR